MIRWQAAVLLCCILSAADPAVGEAGLAALAQARAQVQAVQIEAKRSVGRSDAGPDDQPEVRTVRLTATIDGRYVIIIRPADPADPACTIFQSDGTTSWTTEVIDPEIAPDVKVAKAGVDDAIFRQLLAAVRLDLAALRTSYTVELLAEADGLRRLRLVPSDAGIARDIVQIAVVIDAQGMPQRAVLDLTSGNRETYLILRFADNPPLDPKVFRPANP